MCSYESPALIVICNFLPMLGHYSIFIRMYKASKLVLCNMWKHVSRTFLQIVKQSDVFCTSSASEMQKMSYSCTYIQWIHKRCFEWSIPSCLAAFKIVPLVCMCMQRQHFCWDWQWIVSAFAYTCTDSGGKPLKQLCQPVKIGGYSKERCFACA